MRKVVTAIACSVVVFTACGSDNKSAGTSPTTAAAGPTTAASSQTTAAGSQTTAGGSPAFCTSAKALGSLSKGTQDAMGMSPAEATKDFEALAAKVTTLKAGAPADLVAAIDTVAARFTLEAKAEEMKAKDPNGGQEEGRMLADHQAADDAAYAKLVAGVKSTCNFDIS